MRPDKRVKRQQEKALEAVAALGIDISSLKLNAERLDASPQNKERQGEAALAFLDKPCRFVTKKCLHCDEYFGTNYNSVAYCSFSCRNKAFFEQTGTTVNWGAKSDVERWGGEPPLIIDPETLKHLAVYYQTLLDRTHTQQVTDQSQPQEPQYQVSTGTQLAALVDLSPAHNQTEKYSPQYEPPVHTSQPTLLESSFDLELAELTFHADDV